MANRSPERERFLADVITGAVEGGTNYWAQSSNYRWWSDTLGEGHGGATRHADSGVTLHDMEDGGRTYDVTLDTVAHGIAVLKRGGCVGAPMLGNILAADAENDAGMIDAYDADAIVQAGIFETVVYG